jgi:hypothetical protein
VLCSPLPSSSTKKDRSRTEPGHSRKRRPETTTSDLWETTFAQVAEHSHLLGVNCRHSCVTASATQFTYRCSVHGHRPSRIEKRSQTCSIDHTLFEVADMNAASLSLFKASTTSRGIPVIHRDMTSTTEYTHGNATSYKFLQSKIVGEIKGRQDSSTKCASL